MPGTCSLLPLLPAVICCKLLPTSHIAGDVLCDEDEDEVDVDCVVGGGCDAVVAGVVTLTGDVDTLVGEDELCIDGNNGLSLFFSIFFIYLTLNLCDGNYTYVFSKLINAYDLVRQD